MSRVKAEEPTGEVQQGAGVLQNHLLQPGSDVSAAGLCSVDLIAEEGTFIYQQVPVESRGQLAPCLETTEEEDF